MTDALERNSTDVGRVQHPGSKWIIEHRASLPTNCWVAASAKGLEAENAEIGELMSDLRRKNVDVINVAIAYITPDAV